MNHEKQQTEVKQMIETLVCEDLSDEKYCQYHSAVLEFVSIAVKEGTFFLPRISIASTKVLWGCSVKCFRICNQITKQNCLLLIGKTCTIAIAFKQKCNTEYCAD